MKDRAARLAALGAALGLCGAAHAADPFRGADLYRSHCTVCHGSDGRPLLPAAPDFTRQTSLMKSDFDLLKSVRSGRGAMPGFQGILRDRDILDIVAHLRTLP